MQDSERLLGALSRASTVARVSSTLIAGQDPLRLVQQLQRAANFGPPPPSWPSRARSAARPASAPWSAGTARGPPRPAPGFSGSRRVGQHDRLLAIGQFQHAPVMVLADQRAVGLGGHQADEIMRLGVFRGDADGVARMDFGLRQRALGRSISVSSLVAQKLFGFSATTRRISASAAAAPSCWREAPEEQRRFLAPRRQFQQMPGAGLGAGHIPALSAASAWASSGSSAFVASGGKKWQSPARSSGRAAARNRPAKGEIRHAPDCNEPDGARLGTIRGR